MSKSSKKQHQKRNGKQRDLLEESVSVDSALEQMPVREFSQRAYLDYSMYVIQDRALPHVGDGLKPVQRRIIYAMSELGLEANAKFVKSARTIGDVLGKYHPHGDSACYEAMVLMAQPFSFRYPWVDGQGNWGSTDDPKSFAAMRYTEARLTRYAEILLAELKRGASEWVANFDDTLEEPRALPARLPALLLNGTTGIAVGMATDIPPHNMREVAAACDLLLRKPKTTVEELCECILAPDYPTEAPIITSRESLVETYRTGRGQVKSRAAWSKDGEEVTIYALPYQASPAKITEQIAQQMVAKKLPVVVDIRDESDHENPTRLILKLRSGRVDAERLMSHLFASTDLERSQRVNLNMIGLDGRPRQKGLKQILQEWLEFRTATVRRRLQFQLDRIGRRLEILAGMLVVYVNLDEVIKIIREKDDAKAVLMATFKLNEIQVNAVLEVRLRQLAKLEEKRLLAEQKALLEEQSDLQKKLSSPTRLKTLIRKEIASLAKSFGDDRVSPLETHAESQLYKKEEFLTTEPVTVVLSQRGWIRVAKGHDLVPQDLSYRTGDGYLDCTQGRNDQPTIALDHTGRAYTVETRSLPSARGQGEPLTGHVNALSGIEFISVLLNSPDSLYVLASQAGYGFVVSIGDMIVKNRSGKKIITMSNDRYRPVAPSAVKNFETDILAVVTSKGRLLTYPVRDLRRLARGKGQKLIDISKAQLASGVDHLVGACCVSSDDKLVVDAGARHMKLSFQDLAAYSGRRAGRGKLLPKGFRRVDGLGLQPPKPPKAQNK